MVQENQKRFEELLDEIKSLFPNTTTSVRIIITAEHTKLVQSFKHPCQLKKANISMRNIKGNWIE